MIEIELDRPVGASEAHWGYGDCANEKYFSLDSLKCILAEAAGAGGAGAAGSGGAADDDVFIRIHCIGGEVQEAFAIYDYLRSSGRRIRCQIDGECSSAALIILLAAEKSERVACAHAEGLVHEPYLELWGNFEASELESLAVDLDRTHKMLVDLYVSRCGMPLAVAEALLSRGEYLSSAALLENGFVGSILESDDNEATKNTLNMVKSKNARCSRRLRTVQNYDHFDAGGNLLFTTESETPDLEVGMKVSVEAGTFELPDGVTVVVSDGVIESVSDGTEGSAEAAIEAPEAAAEAVSVAAEAAVEELPIEEAGEAVETVSEAVLEAIAELRGELSSLREELLALKGEVKSVYEPKSLDSVRSTRGSVDRTAEDYLSEIRERRVSRK